MRPLTLFLPAVVPMFVHCIGGPNATSDKNPDKAEEKQCVPDAVRECYSGTPETEGVGICRSGNQTCRSDGSGWGPCLGQVVPSFESCQTNGQDDDCNGVVDDPDDRDLDGDGYSRCQGDCCDTERECSDPKAVNPGATEVVDPTGKASADENCNGEVDEVVTCDEDLALEDSDPIHAARALDVCHTVEENGYGLVSARYTRAVGKELEPSTQHGIQSAFGKNVFPRMGTRMLALSSGAARTPGQPDLCGDDSCNFHRLGSPPKGFPQDVPDCPGDRYIHDDVVLEVTLRAPTNATGYAFDYRFYTFEYPEYICSLYNDQFVAVVQPAPEGSINGNIAFDTLTNPVSINIAFFDVCLGCPEGTDALVGTGFGDAGATSWLRTQAPVQGGSEFTIRFMIWDTGDQQLDSTVIIDNFHWLAEPVDVSTNPID